MTPPILIHEEGRKASWFELFFDLVFVVAVAALAGALSRHYDWAGVLEFGFLFLVLWWLWLGHTFHASRFDKDRPDQWAVGFAQLVAVVFIAYGAGDAFASRAWAFAGGVAAFKALLVFGYLREFARPGLARLCTIYALVYGLQAVLWAGSILATPDLRIGLWAAALSLDVVTPFLVASETHRAPPHPEHLPERFGLFTLILLGETTAAAVHALDHGAELHGDTLAVALLGALLGFLYWVGYFHRAKGNAERRVGDAAAGAALSMVGVTVVSLATYRRKLSSGWPYVLIAGVAAATPVLTSTAPVLVGLLVGVAACQIGLSVALNRPARVAR